MTKRLSDPDFYKEFPKTCDPKDYWGQVKRTVSNKPVPESHIKMIVEAVSQNLKISESDTLLDLCCGNGALSTFFFEQCNGGVGVDFSEYLISIAKNEFKTRESEEYILQDVIQFLKTFQDSNRFTKALCYGAFMFLPRENAKELLMILRERFKKINKFVIGNIPDKGKLNNFKLDKEINDIPLNDPFSPIGIWYSEDEFVEISHNAGWRCQFFRMPPTFYASHYRYDAILTAI